MSMEFGGYLPLELGRRCEYFDSLENSYCLKLNSGRSALSIAARTAAPKKLYIPYYNCIAVESALSYHGIPLEKYRLNSDMEPDIDELGEGEWLLYVNYFGSRTAEDNERLYNKYKRIIFDNTQAFFLPPLLRKDCFNVYSCRKFFGVSDGAYLVFGKENAEIPLEGYPRDASAQRAGYLLRCIEEGTNAAYADSVRNEEAIGYDIKLMSPLTQRILSGVDYDAARAARQRNVRVLKERLGAYNHLGRELVSDDLMIYPLYVEDDSIRAKLIENRIYIPQWWKYIIELLPEDSLECRLSKWLYPLPVDQRYTEEQMNELASAVINIIK